MEKGQQGKDTQTGSWTCLGNREKGGMAGRGRLEGSGGSGLRGLRGPSWLEGRMQVLA